MIGATLEAILTSVVCLLYDEAVKTGKAPKKPLLKWDLGDLLTVAKAAKWLPEELHLDKQLDPLRQEANDSRLGKSDSCRAK
jgi:hypothetical protein